jgi:hypothetical protein
MLKSQAVSCLGCDNPFVAGCSLTLHLHWYPDKCGLAYFTFAVNPSDISFHLPNTAILAPVCLPDHAKMASLLASSNAHASDGPFNADCDQNSIDGDGVEGTVDADKDLNDVFSFPQDIHQGATI